MTNGHKPVGDIKYYQNISVLLIFAFAVEGPVLLYLYSSAGQRKMLYHLGPSAAFGLQLFFWGALAATIAGSLFLAHDKEENEIESIKENPDLEVLRYPDLVDVYLYLQRILSSACLAVVGGLALYAGVSYFDVPAGLSSAKHRAFFIVFAFLVGLYQGSFLTYLSKRFQKLLSATTRRSGGRHTSK